MGLDQAHPIDIAVTVLTLPFAPVAWQAARAFRLLRLLRLARVFSLKRLLSLEGLRCSAGRTRRGSARRGRFRQRGIDQHLSTWDGIWWSVSTVTTVGYGDVYPESDAGRVIAMAIMLVGIGFVALLTAFIADRFIQEQEEVEAKIEAKEDVITRPAARDHPPLDRLERGDTRA